MNELLSMYTLLYALIAMPAVSLAWQTAKWLESKVGERE